jgi:murein L,D-transpeptidase YcbB/YkuD
MPATGPEITRWAALFTLCAAPVLAADPSQEAWEVVTALASALGRSDARDFLSVCDPAMPAYAALRRNVSALVAQADAESGIDPVRNDGDHRAREMVVDWQLHLVDRTGLQHITARRENIQLRLEMRESKWKVVGIDRIAFFAPPGP